MPKTSEDLFMEFAYCYNCHGGEMNCKCKIMEAVMELAQFQKAISKFADELLKSLVPCKVTLNTGQIIDLSEFIELTIKSKLEMR